jgi:hypothetical protein
MVKSAVVHRRIDGPIKTEADAELKPNSNKLLIKIICYLEV